jgi:hypothetical protein
MTSAKFDPILLAEIDRRAGLENRSRTRIIENLLWSVCFPNESNPKERIQARGDAELKAEEVRRVQKILKIFKGEPSLEEQKKAEKEEKQRAKIAEYEARKARRVAVKAKKAKIAESESRESQESQEAKRTASQVKAALRANRETEIPRAPVTRQPTRAETLAAIEAVKAAKQSQVT